MKSRDIRPGKYAVKVGGRIIPAGVVRPVKNHRGRWVIVIDETISDFGASVQDRTTDVTSQAIVAPWDEYSTDTAHEAAIHEDRMRAMSAEYEAERAAFAKRAEPTIDTLRGITVPGDEMPGTIGYDKVDLGEFLHAAFVKDSARGTTFTFATFEAIAREIERLREMILSVGGEWAGDVIDTGRPEIMVAETNTALAAVERLAAVAAEREAQPPAGVSPEAMVELDTAESVQADQEAD